MQTRHFLIALSLLASFTAHAGESEDIQQLIQTRQLTQALERADKHIAANPKDAQVRFLKGIIQAELNQSDEAIRTFSSLASDYPQLPEPYNNLAVLYAKQNQLDKARTALILAIQTKPEYAIAHENLGDLYLRLAAQSYERSLQLGNNALPVKNKLKLTQEIQSKSTTAALAKSASPGTKR